MRNPIALLKLITAVGRLVKRPEELDRVIRIVDILEELKTDEEVDAILGDVRALPYGPEALIKRPSIGTLNPSELATLPETTLGGTYGRFMMARGLSQASFPEFKIKSDMDWIISHFYETHDLWHVLTGFDTTISGELGVQAFYLAQTRSYLPFFVIAALLVNTAIYSYEEKDLRMQAIADGWNLGKRAKNLFGHDWRKYLDSPLNAVRSEFNIKLESNEIRGNLHAEF